MATHTQMSRTAANADAVQGMAALLLSAADADWTDWELDFLENMRRYEGPEPISMRQREVLFELKDKAATYRDYRGLAVRNLVNRCWIARLDLDEDDEAFIAGLHDAGKTSVKRAAFYRLVRCARALGVIDDGGN